MDVLKYNPATVLNIISTVDLHQEKGLDLVLQNQSYLNLTQCTGLEWSSVDSNLRRYSNMHYIYTKQMYVLVMLRHMQYKE